MNVQTIRDLNIPGLAAYQVRNENRLLHWYEPAPGIFIAESQKVLIRALSAGYQPLSVLAEEKCLPLLPPLPPDCPVYAAPHDVLEQITGYALTGGVLSVMRRRPLPAVPDILGECRRVAVLQHVTNPTNAGAIVRSAAALGMDAVLFTDGCTDPLARRAVRVSMGCIFQIPWTVGRDPRAVISALKECGFRTCAMALRDDSRRINDPALSKTDKLALFLGNEGDGLPADTLAACDETLLIPMRRSVDSLNVAAAAAIAFWELGRACGEQHVTSAF